jgi:hypothetical protein
VGDVTGQVAAHHRQPGQAEVGPVGHVLSRQSLL